MLDTVLLLTTVLCGTYYTFKYKKINSINYSKDRIKLDSSLGLFSGIYKIVIVSTILLVTIPIYWQHKIFITLFKSDTMKTVGIMMLIGGTVLFKASIDQIGEHYSPCYDRYFPKSIIMTGPYKYIRHPIYLSNIMTILGFFLATGSLWILINVGIIFGYYLKSMIDEERELSGREEYVKYQQRTGMILPRIFSIK